MTIATPATPDRLSPRVQARFAAVAAEAPESGAWLALVGAALDEIALDRLALRIDRRRPRAADAPALDGCTLSVAADGASPACERLLAAARRAGGHSFAALRRPGARDAIDVATLLTAALHEDDDALRALATTAAVEPRAFSSLARLCAVPILFAARRALEASSRGNVPSAPSALCPVCGALPLLAESRGLAREHRRRCGRCGADWAAPELSCAFCPHDDASRLRSLVPDAKPVGRRIQACLACRGYVKVLPTLDALAPEQVLLEDVASVDLDVAAASLGYARPAASPAPLDAHVFLRREP